MVKRRRAHSWVPAVAITDMGDYLVVLEHPAVEVGQGDGAELVLFGLRGAQALPWSPQ